jgi:geranylgeranyl transferase type-2 subunit beta
MYEIRGTNRNKQSFEWVATEHFRLSGVYWGLTAMHLLGREGDMDNSDDILVST